MAGELSHNVASLVDVRPIKIKTEQIDAIRRYPDRQKHEQPARRPQSGCGNCGMPHQPPDICPAHGKTCSTCGRLHHFAKVCRGGAPPNRPGFRKNRHPTLRQLSLEDPEEVYHTQQCEKPIPRLYDDKDEEVFTISFTGRENQQKRPPPMCKVEIEGVEISALIDTGASVNVIDEVHFGKLSPRPTISSTTACIYTYGGTVPLPLRGVIQVKVVNEGRSTTAKFHVTEGNTGTLLRCHTAEDLGLVYFARQVHESHADNILNDFPQLFKGLGCLKGWKIKQQVYQASSPQASTGAIPPPPRSGK